MLKKLVNIGLVVIVAAAFAAYLQTRLSHQLPVLKKLEDVALVTSEGKQFSIEDLRGKTHIAHFMFTNCDGPCPLLTAQASKLATRFSGRPDIRLLSISVDPERDTPEVMAEYAAQFNIPQEDWLFLTGELEGIKHVTRSLQGAVPESVDAHPTRFYLIDENARLRGSYLGLNDGDLQPMFEDIEKLWLG